MALVPAGYIEGVRLAGGLPLVLPPTPEGAREPGEVLDAIDGLVLIGGPDLGVDLYGSPARAPRDRPQAGAARRLRARAPRRGAPARPPGARHLPRHAAPRRRRRRRPRTAPRRRDRSHAAPPCGRACSAASRSRSSPGLGRAALLGRPSRCTPPITRASGGVGEGLVVAARAPDGQIEAVEDPEQPFCLGVLWHPEEDPAGCRGAALPRARRGSAPLRRRAHLGMSAKSNTGRTARGREAARPVKVRLTASSASSGWEAAAGCPCPSRAGRTAEAGAEVCARPEDAVLAAAEPEPEPEPEPEAAAALRLLRLLDRREHVLQVDALRLGDRVEPITRGKSLGEVGGGELERARGRVDDSRAGAHLLGQRREHGGSLPLRQGVVRDGLIETRLGRGDRGVADLVRRLAGVGRGLLGGLQRREGLLERGLRRRVEEAEERPGEPWPGPANPRGPTNLRCAGGVVVVVVPVAVVPVVVVEPLSAPRELLAAATAPPPASAATASPTANPWERLIDVLTSLAGCLLTACARILTRAPPIRLCTRSS